MNFWKTELGEQVKARFKELRLDGYSASQIAELAQAQFHIAFTRNTVIGQLLRMQVASSTVKQPRITVSTPRLKLVAPAVEEKGPEAIGPINEFAPKGCCQHIAAESLFAPGARMCGHPVKHINTGVISFKTGLELTITTSWCEYHYRTLHQPITPAQEKAIGAYY